MRKIAAAAPNEVIARIESRELSMFLIDERSGGKTREDEESPRSRDNQEERMKRGDSAREVSDLSANARVSVRLTWRPHERAAQR